MDGRLAGSLEGAVAECRKGGLDGVIDICYVSVSIATRMCVNIVHAIFPPFILGIHHYWVGVVLKVLASFYVRIDYFCAGAADDLVLVHPQLQTVLVGLFPKMF